MVMSALYEHADEDNNEPITWAEPAEEPDYENSDH